MKGGEVITDNGDHGQHQSKSKITFYCQVDPECLVNDSPRQVAGKLQKRESFVWSPLASVATWRHPILIFASA